MPCRLLFRLDCSVARQLRTVTASFHEDVETLSCRAQTALGVGRGQLLNSLGSVLDVHAPIKDSSLQNGDY